MKYILILLVSFAFGQDFIPVMPTYNPYAKYMEAQVTEKIMMVHNNMTAWEQPITLHQLLEYAEECYNDSIHVSYFGLICTAEYETDTSATLTGICYPDSTINIYPTTPTFEGFIDWITRNR